MTYVEALQFLYGLRVFGTKLGLSNAFKLAALTGDPQKGLRFIHVAGTNGKGSTCAMLESIYRQAGLRVGLFTSPHLVSFGERIQVNRQNIPEEEVCRLMTRLADTLSAFRRDEHPTFFEVVTIMGLLYFAAEKCDLVIWETGLGGRLDATNIVTPLASVITNVQFDHEKWLGQTLTSIAFEKAGIIKPGISVLTAATEPEAIAMIEATARERQAPLTRICGADEPGLFVPENLSLLGEHQRINAALAIATVHALRTEIPLSESVIREGLAKVSWPGRLQLITGPRQQKVLLDGAHNPAGAKSLAAALDQLCAGAAPTLVLGILEDKNWNEICQALAPRFQQILLVPVSSERTADPVTLAVGCQRANPDARTRVCMDLPSALELALQNDFVVVTGSLYLVGEALTWLLGKTDSLLERQLNEWSAPRRT